MKTVLVVDDSATVRQQVGMSLKQAGYDVIEAKDGQEGVEVLDKRSVNAVVCDVNMPRLNGLELVEKVKKNPVHKSLPIVMLTTEGNPKMIERAKKAGAVGWIVKPFKAKLLIAAIDKLTSAAS